jgi:response regulator RpfG family c-di-GMP phosphodiesterase
MSTNESIENKNSFRVLASHHDTGTLRLLRDSVSNLLNIGIDTTPSSEYAYEMAIKRTYSLFIFGYHMPNLNGVLLYDLLYKVYPSLHEGTRKCPAVIFIGEEDDIKTTDQIKRDARVKDILIRPLSIDRIIGVIEDPMSLTKTENTKI